MNDKFKADMEIMKGTKEFYHGIAKKAKSGKKSIRDSSVINKVRNAMFSNCAPLKENLAPEQMNTYEVYVDICKSRGITPCEETMYSDCYFVCQCMIDSNIEYIDKDCKPCGNDTSNITKFATITEAVDHAGYLVKRYKYNAGIKFITEYRKRKTVMTYAPDLQGYSDK